MNFISFAIASLMGMLTDLKMSDVSDFISFDNLRKFDRNTTE